MSEQEKIEELADILELDPDELDRDMVLDEMDTWDSIAVLSVISIMNEFDRFPHADEIRGYRTVGDLLDAMG